MSGAIQTINKDGQHAHFVKVAQKHINQPLFMINSDDSLMIWNYTVLFKTQGMGLPAGSSKPVRLITLRFLIRLDLISY